MTTANPEADAHWVSSADVDALVSQKMAELDAQHAAEMQALRDQITGSASPTAGLYPDNAAGPGSDVAESWSQGEQDEANAIAEAARRQARQAS